MKVGDRMVEKISLKGQLDFRGALIMLGMVFAGFVVLSVLDAVVTGIGLPTALNGTYTEVLDKGGLFLKIAVFGLIMYVVWTLFLRG